MSPAINFAMLGVEIASGIGARSVPLLADSLGFLGDAANYGVSLFAFGVFGAGIGWPDFTVGAIMAVPALDGAW